MKTYFLQVWYSYKLKKNWLPQYMQSILHSYFIHRIFRSPFHGHTKLSLVTNVNAKYPWSGKALGMISWDYATLQNSDHIQTEISVYFFLRLSGMDCFIPLTSSPYFFFVLELQVAFWWIVSERLPVTLLCYFYKERKLFEKASDTLRTREEQDPLRMSTEINS